LSRILNDTNSLINFIGLIIYAGIEKGETLLFNKMILVEEEKWKG
jgi:hypothetical protein